jgi:tetratricopeptide (TPR) repeat protein
LAANARKRLAAGGQRAHLRADWGAAARLFERAAALVPPTEIDFELEVDLIDALFWAGGGVEALRRADSLAERAAAAGNRVGELCARVRAGELRINLEPEGATENQTALLEQALPVFEAARDDFALCTGFYALGWVAAMRARMDAGVEAFDRAAFHARRAGRKDEFVGWRASVRLWGSTPVGEVLAWLDAHEPREGTDHRLRASRAWALAMLGRTDEARVILAETRAQLAERGGGIELAIATGMESVNVELLAGDPAAAAEFGTAGCRLFEELDDKSIFSSAAGFLGQALYALGRLEEADAWARRAAEIGASDDVLTQFLWRQVRAKVLARRGDRAEAERLALEAVAISERTDQLVVQGDVYGDLAEVLSLAGRWKDAAAALEQALDCYERKGNLVSAQRTRTRLTELLNAASR